MSNDRNRLLRVWRLLLLVLGLPLAAQQAAAANRQIRIPHGNGDFRFIDRKGDPSKEVTVFTYLPRNLKASEAPIVFVRHGHHRSAESYRNDWAQHADHFGFMVLAPFLGGHGSDSALIHIPALASWFNERTWPPAVKSSKRKRPQREPVGLLSDRL